MLRCSHDHAPIDLVVPGRGCAAPEAVDIGAEEYGGRVVSDTKFTSGPWVVDFGGTIGHVKSVAENEYANTPTVARYDIGIPGVSESEQYANAQLIAAAPELYEALTRCKFDSLNMTVADLEFCKAAMAKARGEKS